MAYAKLSVKALAITGAILWAAYMFLLALLVSAGVSTVWFSQGIVDMLAFVYPGFVATIGGAFLGLVYGAVCGAICGGLVSWVYNKFA